MKNKQTQYHPSRETTKNFYDNLASRYDRIAGNKEEKATLTALSLLDIQPNESVLEIGFGTGRALPHIINLSGSAYGIDLSTKMLETAEKRLISLGISSRAHLSSGDALALPYSTSFFDAVFSSFTLELFSTTDIPILLGEILRVLKPNGRLSIVSLNKPDKPSLMTRLYEWFHNHFPHLADCRPIRAAEYLENAGFQIDSALPIRLWGINVIAIVARRKQ